MDRGHSPIEPARHLRADVLGVLRRVAAPVVTLALVSVIAFGATSVRPPGDIARATLGRDATPAQIHAFRAQHDLDGSVVDRYLAWATGVLSGDLGTSYVTGRAVSEDVVPRLQRSLTLAAVAVLAGVPLALLIGVLVARVGGRLDLGVLVVSTILTALPEFVVGIALLLALAVGLGWLPVESSAAAGGTPSAVAAAYVLPALTLIVVSAPYVIRMTREAVRETLRAPFVRSAVLRGLPRRRVVWEYAVVASAAPIVNAVAINLVFLIGGAIVVENLFAFPGIGQLIVQAINNGDVITVQAVTLLLGAAFVAINASADLLVRIATPQARSAER